MGVKRFLALAPSSSTQWSRPRRRASARRHVPGEVPPPSGCTRASRSRSASPRWRRMEETTRCLRCDIRSAEQIRRLRLDPEAEGPHRRRVRRRHSRPDRPRGGAGQQQVHPRPVLHGGPQRGRRVPAVHGRGVRRRAPAARLHDPRPGGHGGHHRPRRRSRPTARSRSSCCFSERNHVCAVCVSSGHCELQALAAGARGDARALPLQLPAAARSTPRTRASCSTTTAACCARAACAPAAEIEGAHVWDIAGRGIQSRLVSELKRPWGEAKPAPAAASACRPARPGPWPRRAGRSRR